MRYFFIKLLTGHTEREIFNFKIKANIYKNLMKEKKTAKEKAKNSRFYIRKAKSGQFYFVLTAENGKIIAQSEMYESKQSCEQGIVSVIRNAPHAEVKEDFKD